MEQKLYIIKYALSLFDLEGNFVDGLRSGTCSHEGLKDSFDGSYRVMKEQLEILFTRNNITVKDIAGAGFGLAGADLPCQSVMTGFLII